MLYADMSQANLLSISVLIRKPVIEWPSVEFEQGESDCQGAQRSQVNSTTQDAKGKVWPVSKGGSIF